MGVYRVELATSARATCKNTECKKNQVKIPKGDLRFCTQTEINGGVSWAYKHWGCTTPQQIKNLKDSIENNIDYLDGLDELPSELRLKVLKALEDGHVDDSDWRGDLSQNRPGSTSFRSPAPKKTKKKSKSGDNGDENDGGSPPPPPKKRGRGKKAEDADDDNEPPAKKAKTVSKKGKSEKKEEIMDEQEIKAPPPKKGRGRAKKAQTMPDPELIPVQAETSNRQVMSKSPSKTKQAEGSVFASTEVHSEKQGDGAEDGAFEEPKAKNGWKKTGKKVPDDLEETSKEAKQMNSPTAEANNEIEIPRKTRGRPRAKLV